MNSAAPLSVRGLLPLPPLVLRHPRARAWYPRPGAGGCGMDPRVKPEDDGGWDDSRSKTVTDRQIRIRRIARYEFGGAPVCPWPPAAPSPQFSVIPGLEPGIHGLALADAAWVLGSSPRKTEGGVTAAAKQRRIARYEFGGAPVCPRPAAPRFLPVRPLSFPSSQALSLGSTAWRWWMRHGSSGQARGRRRVG